MNRHNITGFIMSILSVLVYKDVTYIIKLLFFFQSSAQIKQQWSSWGEIRELTNRRLLHDAAIRLRDMLTAHALLSTCQLRAKGDDAGESDLPAS